LFYCFISVLFQLRGRHNTRTSTFLQAEATNTAQQHMAVTNARLQ